MNWPNVPFEEIYTIPSRNGVYKSKEFHGRGCRIVNMGELFGFDFISNQGMNRVELKDSELSNNLLVDGDLLFGRRSLVESGAGKCSLVISPGDDLTFESSIIRVRLNKEIVNPRYFFYYFKSPQGRGRVGSIVSGTNVKGIRGGDLKKLSIPIPPKEHQDTAVDILSAYDDLIENNNRQIQLLEQAARQLYNEWFVRLRFPGHEQAKVVDGVPEGFCRMSLADLCQEKRDVVRPEKLNPETPYIGLEHMPRRSITLGDWEFADKVSSSKHKFQVGDILFGKIRPYFHKVGITFTDGIASSDALVIRSLRNNLLPLVLMVVSSDAFIAMTSKTVKEGSKMPRADWKHMQRYPVLLPPEGLLNSFNSAIEPILDQLRTLVMMNKKLQEARDLLLPRLMSGEIRA